MLQKSFPVPDVLNVIGGLHSPMGIPGVTASELTLHIVGSEDYANAKIHGAAVKALLEQNPKLAWARDDAIRLRSDDQDAHVAWARKWQKVLQQEFPAGVEVTPGVRSYAHMVLESASRLVPHLPHWPVKHAGVPYQG
jgi:hypothetical protein